MNVVSIIRRQGIDQAVKLSGDRRETIEKYYMDPYKSDVPLVLTAPLGRIGGGGADETARARPAGGGGEDAE